MLDAFFSRKTDFKRFGEETVRRDGITGTRWHMSWDENGIVFSSVMEIFGEGDDYYRIATIAPKETYERYSETFENVLHSLHFPMLHVDTHILDSQK